MRPSQSLSPNPGAWRAKDKPPSQTRHASDGLLQLPLCGAGLRQCGAAIFWPHAALHPPTLHSGANPGGAGSGPQGSHSRCFLPSLCLEVSTSVSPGRAAPHQWTRSETPVHSERPAGSLCPWRGCPSPTRYHMRGPALAPHGRDRGEVSGSQCTSQTRAVVHCQLWPEPRFPKYQEPLSLRGGIVGGTFLSVCLPIYFVVFLFFLYA